MTSPNRSNGEPLAVPAVLAETVFAALDYALGHLQKNDGRMSTEMVGHLGKVLVAYDHNRSRYLMTQNVPPQVIERFSKSAADSLVAWIGKQDRKIEDNNADFERWAKELGDE